MPIALDAANPNNNITRHTQTHDNRRHWQHHHHRHHRHQPCAVVFPQPKRNKKKSIWNDFNDWETRFSALFNKYNK